jgi:hypothetical protein
VSDTLRGMGLSVEDEFRCPKSGYSIDMRVHVNRHARQFKEQHRGCGRVGSGVRRALAFFDLQVDCWWDLDEAAAS